MKNPHDVLIAPIVTERSVMSASEGKYTFQVAPNATKTEIRLACEQLFQVKVLGVNTMRMDGKVKRMGVHVGRRPQWKKAIVTIDTNPETASYLDKSGKKVESARKYKTEIEEFGFSH